MNKAYHLSKLGNTYEAFVEDIKMRGINLVNISDTKTKNLVEEYKDINRNKAAKKMFFNENN